MNCLKKRNYFNNNIEGLEFFFTRFSNEVRKLVALQTFCRQKNGDTRCKPEPEELIKQTSLLNKFLSISFPKNFNISYIYR